MTADGTVIPRAAGPRDPVLDEEKRKESTMHKVNLLEKFALFQDQFSPKVVGDLNDHQVKLVKLQGEFVWHHHENEDEMFLVVRGRMRMGLRTGDIELSEGEFFIVPKGTEHKPSAEQECWIVLLEPKTTLNTGNVVGERTVAELDRI
jgi:mannose-6-phosphate isomerase-like protein (cupin superfamily)